MRSLLALIALLLLGCHEPASQAPVDRSGFDFQGYRPGQWISDVRASREQMFCFANAQQGASTCVFETSVGDVRVKVYATFTPAGESGRLWQVMVNGPPEFERLAIDGMTGRFGPPAETNAHGAMWRRADQTLGIVTTPDGVILGITDKRVEQRLAEERQRAAAQNF